MIEDLHGGAHLGAAHAHRADGPRIQEPVQHVEVVAVLLDDEVARVVVVAEPVAQLLDFRIGVRDALERIAGDPERARIHQFADLAGLSGACTLPGTPGRSAAGSRRTGSSWDPALREAAIDVLTPARSTPIGFSQ